MVGKVRKLARSMGFDINRFPGAATHWPRLAEMLDRHTVTLVLDVGANIGQYAYSLRNNGYRGRIVSFEPLSAAHADLTVAADLDPEWQVAPRCAVGAAAGESTLNISPESDMSSLLLLTADAAEKFASVRPTASESVPMTTLAVEIPRYAAANDAIFVKSDTQGYEAEVLDGLAGAADRVVGLQLELSLLPIYQGQPDYLSVLNRVGELGFVPHLVIPGYFSRQHRQMIEFDVVCFRDGAS
ncbi:MAG: FkbM family methyltransferase [Alphaproteobacteria bacterium]|nr:FkbM family methyltransferase [Alphaproteobacteria bacterium]